jgi:hypothetical protein
MFSFFKIIGWGALALVLLPLVILHWIGIVSVLLLVMGALAFLEV